MTIFISEDDSEAVLDWDASVDALEHAFAEAAVGRAMSDPRTDRLLLVSKDAIAERLGIEPVELRDRLFEVRNALGKKHAGYIEWEALEWPLVYSFKTMVGTVKDRGLMALRINSEILAFDEEGEGRREAKIPLAPGFRYTGLVFLFSIITGELVAIVQDGHLQRSRVAATAAVGTRYLSREDSEVVGLIGSGAIAEAHVFSTLVVRPGIKQIRVYSPTRSHRESFARDLSERTGLEVVAVGSGAEAYGGADIAVESTNAHAPIIDAKWLAPGTHFVWTSPGAAGLDCYDWADLVVTTWRGNRVDKTPEIRRYTLEAEADQVPEFVAGGVAWDRMVAPELGEIVTGAVAGRVERNQRTLHANMSSALQFAAVGSAIYERCREQGRGRLLDEDSFAQLRHL